MAFQPMKGHAEKLKKELSYAVNEANDEKLDQKEEKVQILNLQERMDKIILKLATLKISTCFNIQ